MVRPSFRWQLKRSLAFRIFILCLLLLIIPLIVHTGFMYLEEYRDEVHDALISLQIASEDEVQNLKKSLLEEQKLLTFFTEEMRDYSILPSSQITPFLQKRAKHFGISQLFIMERVKGSFTGKYSSDPSLKGKDYTFLRPKGGSFFFFSSKDQKIYIGVKGVFSEYLVASFPLQKLITNLQLGSFPFPIAVTYLDSQNHVVLSTNPDWEKTFFHVNKQSSGIYLEKREKEKNAYTFEAKDKFLAVMLPIEDTRWKLMLSVKRSFVKELKISDYFWRIFVFFLFFLFIGGGLTYFLMVRFTKPLKTLFRTMQKIESGDVSARFKEDRLGFEINVIGAYFNTMMQSLLNHQREAQNEAVHRKLAEKELLLAHDIQESLLPKNLQDFSSLEIGTAFSPSSHVGGDFYDIFSPSKGKVLFYIADIAGKGMEAGLYALSLRSYIRGAASRGGDLNAIIEEVNQLFYEDAEEKNLFATLWMGIYEEEAGRLFYTSLGHPPAYFIQENELQPLECSNVALGLQKGKFATRSIVVHKKDMILFYTDGVFEAEDKEGKFFSLHRLQRLLLEKRKLPPQKLVDAIFEEVKSFQKEQKDDSAAVAIRFTV